MITEYQKVAESHSLDLGPNRIDLLNFWIFVENLTCQQLKIIGDRYDNLCAIKKKKNGILIV
jgi:hypothetical protein